MKSVMAHAFSKVPLIDIPRSVFNRSSGYKTTLEAGYLVPFFFDDIIPGDTFKLSTSFLLRFNDLLRPFMDNLFVDTFYFFVPYRLVWDNWVKMCGEQVNPGDSTDYLVPVVNIKAEDRMPQTLYDYFAVPQAGQTYLSNGYQLVGSMVDGVYTPTSFKKISDGTSINYTSVQGVDLRNQLCSPTALRFRAYNLIWNEWFRDENLQDQVSVPKGDGPDDSSIYSLLKRGKRHDYFTSCLPWPQKGPAVNLPLGKTAPVIGTDYAIRVNSISGASGSPAYHNYYFGVQGGLYDSDIGAVGLWHGWGDHLRLNNESLSDLSSSVDLSWRGHGLYFDKGHRDSPFLVADLSGATAATINQLREAFAIQRMFEKDARGGTRYTEILQNHFHVLNPDLRLQRPEFLSHACERINVISVPQSSSATSTSPQGNLAAYSVTGGSSGFQHSFNEYGVVIGLMCIRADLTYQQGLDRDYSKRTRFDFYWPGLAHLGEQSVLNKELFFSNDVDNEKVFGYQERYAEYRYRKSYITGYLNSVAPLAIDQWHLSQKFENLPTLSSDFIEENPPIDRVVAVKDQPPFLLDTYFDLKSARTMPVYGVPGLMDHY